MTTHTPRELQDLLAAFPELGIVKIEAEHPVPGLDRPRVTLEARRSTRFDVSASVEEEYVASYISTPNELSERHRGC